MNTKPEKETVLNIPVEDALTQALSFLQKSNNPDDLKLSDIKKAVACIENGAKQDENLLPEVEEILTEDLSEDSDLTNEVIPESAEIPTIPELEIPEIEMPENPTEEDISNIFQEIQDDNDELANIDDIKNSQVSTYRNVLPVDTEYVKEMNATIEQSLYAYRELLTMGLNAATGKGVADIAQASNAFLKLAYDARNSKLKHRMDLRKLEIEERKLKIQEVKAFKDASVADDVGVVEEEKVSGIKFTPSMREELIKNNLPPKS